MKTMRSGRQGPCLPGRHGLRTGRGAWRRYNRVRGPASCYPRKEAVGTASSCDCAFLEFEIVEAAAVVQCGIVGGVVHSGVGFRSFRFTAS